MRTVFGFLLMTVLLTGCEYDYNVGLDYKPQVVLNSIINPDSTILVNLFWTKEAGVQGDYKPIEDFSAKIYENDNLIFEGGNLKDSIKTTYKPVEGARYSIEIEVPGYGLVRAETWVPQPPIIEIKHRIDSSSWTHNYHFEINKILSESELRSIVIRALGLYDSGKAVSLNSLYANNPFCDQFNAYPDQFLGNGTYYEHFIRVPHKSMELATPISILIEGGDFDDDSEHIIVGYDDWGYPIYEDISGNLIGIAVEVIAPSDEYDKYYKTAYQHWNFGDTGVPVFNVNIPVYSNVENGLGIFAGYSYASFKVEVKQDEE